VCPRWPARPRPVHPLPGASVAWRARCLARPVFGAPGVWRVRCLACTGHGLPHPYFAPPAPGGTIELGKNLTSNIIQLSARHRARGTIEWAKKLLMHHHLAPAPGPPSSVAGPRSPGSRSSATRPRVRTKSQQGPGAEHRCLICGRTSLQLHYNYRPAPAPTDSAFQGGDRLQAGRLLVGITITEPDPAAVRPEPPPAGTNRPSTAR
jgi:hypothetical protein